MIRNINFDDIDLGRIPVKVKMELNPKQYELAQYVVSELRRSFPEIHAAIFEQVPNHSEYLQITILVERADEDRIIEIRTVGADIVSDILVDYGYMMLVGVYEYQPEFA